MKKIKEKIKINTEEFGKIVTQVLQGGKRIKMKDASKRKKPPTKD